MPYIILPTPRGASAFKYPDPEGMPNAQRNRYHGALDWFAAGGTSVRSPVDGLVVEVKPSRGDTGQVFGGVVKVEEDDTGHVYVMRHVDPTVREGEEVDAGDIVARVTNWQDGP